MPIISVLELSTAHLKSTDAKLLEALFSELKQGHRVRTEGLIVDPIDGHGYHVDSGCWVECDGARGKSAVAAGFSEEFVAIMMSADTRSLMGVRFHCDADIDGDFPHFDWENDDMKYEGEEYLGTPSQPAAAP